MLSRMSLAVTLLLGVCQMSFAQPTTITDRDATSTSSDPGKCAQDLLNWCKEQDYSKAVQSVTVRSFYDDGKLVLFSCATSSVGGTNCQRNNEPWFRCFTNKTMTYENQPLTADTSDPDVCKAKEQLFAMIKQNDFSREAFERNMENFNRQMEAFSKFMSRIFGSGFPFRNDYDYDSGSKYHYNIGGDSRRTTQFDDEP